MMRVKVAIVLALCWSAVLYSTASTILVFVSPQEAVIAADSLSNRMEGGQRLVCKIVQVSDHMLFMAAGIGATEYPHFDPYDLARISSSKARSPHEAAVKYASAALEPLQQIWQANRLHYLERGKGLGSQPKGPQAFAFVGLDENGNIAAAGTDFVEDSATAPKLRPNRFQEFSGKNSDDIFIYSMGIVERVPSPSIINAWIYSDKIGAPAALKRAIEAQIKATPKLVGPPISIIRLRRDGSIHWVCKGMCQ